MKRQDDFEQRRKHIANLSDKELYDRFWELTAQVVDPLLELGRKNTTPSVERGAFENGDFLPRYTENCGRLHGQRSDGTWRRSCCIQAVQSEKHFHQRSRGSAGKGRRLG